MLTDYHVHLRPDEEDATAERYFTAANAERYRETAAERGIEELGVAEHVHRFSQALEVWENPWYRHWAVDDLDEYARFVREDTDLRLGIEADFLPGARTGWPTSWTGAPGTTWSARSTSCATRPWTCTGPRAGRPGHLALARPREGLAPVLRDARGAGPLRPLRHHGPPRPGEGLGRAGARPDGDLRRFYELAMDGIAESDVAIEVSTAGWRKPVRGDLPGRPFLEMCLDAGRPVALSSDAQRPSTSATSTSARSSG